MTTDRRNPYRPFQPSLIEEFLQGREILSVELMPQGKSNSNYKLTLSDGPTCLLRLYSHGDGAREAHIMGLVKELVPVPREIYRGDGWSVFDFLPGVPLQECPEHSDKAAEALARIASVGFESSGWINADGSVSPFEFGTIRGYIALMLENPQVQSWAEAELIQAIESILAQESALLDELESYTRLVHGDFNPTNILIHQGEVSGVLDWEYSHSGTPYMDIGNLLRNTPPEHHHRIQKGLEYGGLGLPEDWKERAVLADLTSQLEFLTSTRSDGFKRECVGRMQAFVQRFSRS